MRIRLDIANVKFCLELDIKNVKFQNSSILLHGLKKNSFAYNHSHGRLAIRIKQRTLNRSCTSVISAKRPKTSLCFSHNSQTHNIKSNI